MNKPLTEDKIIKSVDIEVADMEDIASAVQGLKEQIKVTEFNVGGDMELLKQYLQLWIDKWFSCVVKK